MAITYKGFNTQGKNFSNSYTLTGFDIAKQDLVNHFNIRKGEKLQNPAFGSIIWDSLYEPMTDVQVEAVKQNIREILDYDPRLSAQEINVDQYEHGLVIEVNLKFIPDQIMERLLFDFNTDTETVTVSTV